MVIERRGRSFKKSSSRESFSTLELVKIYEIQGYFNFSTTIKNTFKYKSLCKTMRLGNYEHSIRSTHPAIL